MRLGFGEILLILAIALLVFGPSKLPQLGEALGKGIRNFKKGTLEPEADEAGPDQAEQHRLAAASPEARPATSPDPVASKRA